MFVVKVGEEAVGFLARAAIVFGPSEARGPSPISISASRRSIIYISVYIDSVI